jgi:hypothetical protein
MKANRGQFYDGSLQVDLEVPTRLAAPGDEGNCSLTLTYFGVMEVDLRPGLRPCKALDVTTGDNSAEWTGDEFSITHADATQPFPFQIGVRRNATDSAAMECVIRGGCGVAVRKVVHPEVFATARCKLK